MTATDSEVCFIFSLSPEQTRLKDLSATSLQPTSNESLPSITHREAPFSVCLHRSLDDQENCAIEQAGIAASQQDRRPKRNVQAEPGKRDQEKHAAPIRPCRKKDSLTSDQKLDHFSVTPISEVISVQIKMKDASCEIPIESTTKPTLLHTVPPLETKEIKCITSKPNKEIKHDEHTSSLSVIKKIHLPRQAKKSGRSNSDKETAAQDLKVSNEEFVQPVQLDNTALGHVKPKQPVGNTSMNSSSITSRVAEDILGGGQIEAAKQTTNPVPRPRVRKGLQESFTDYCTSTVTASQTSHCEKVQTTEEGAFLSVLPTSDQLSVVEQSKPLPDLQAAFSASMADISEKLRPTSVPCMENSTPLHLRATSEGGSVPVHSEDVLQLEKDVLEAMQEVFTLEDTAQVQDQTVQGFALTNEPSVTNKLKNNDIGNDLEGDVDRFGTITAPSRQDEWLHVEPKKDIEEMKIYPSSEVRDEEFDFGFVSVNVAADCSENQR